MTIYNWLYEKSTCDVIAALSSDGAEVRFVGGCIRDSLLGIKTENLDIDIVTTDTPPKVINLLKSANIRALPIGIEYGTVMAVCHGKTFEITTLREDIKTFGRKAIVSYTTDFKKDAARRDFTINAIYLSTDGKEIFDYFGGQKDLEKGIVKFIGNASERIKEDRLRILRFFRFYAYCGKGVPDTNAIKACSAAEKKIEMLSAERIGREFLKLLKAENPLPTLFLMKKNLPNFLPNITELNSLENFIKIEKTVGTEPDPIKRLAVLLNKETNIADFSNYLRLSKKEKNRIIYMKSEVSKTFNIKEEIYRFDKDIALDKAFMVALSSENNIKELKSQIKICKNWVKPRFPISGNDLIKMGFKGKKLGLIKENLEFFWIQCNFKSTRENLLQKAKEYNND